MTDTVEAQAGAAPVYSPSPAFERVHVIINPASGAEVPVLKPMNTAFSELGLDWDVTITKGPGDAERSARAAAENGVDVVAVYGGDGTVLDAACGLVGSGVPMLILPGGTANVVSMELGIPRDLTGALALLAPGASRLRRVDMGRTGDHYFFHLGMGLEGEMIKAATREEKDKSGLRAYLGAVLRNLRSLPPVRYHLMLDGKQIEVEGVNLMITNFGSLGVGGLSLSKDIDMSDGLMDVLVIHKVDFKSVVEAATGALTQGEVGQPLSQWQAREVVVIADPPQTMTRDGEVFEGREIRAEVVPHAVRIVVPLADED
ncbi:MAG: NAD(+)/NADH kinase [Anaerolineae bacterium]|nr:NAD(+)/NADH kinase [Anaerolineae bacterium]